MFKKILVGFLLFGLLYVFFFPVGLPLETWTPPEHPGYEGEYKLNDKLLAAQKATGLCAQCEDAHLWRGQIVGGDVDGNIVAFDGDQRTIIGNTGGRPLGLDVDSSGNLIIADAMKGLLSMDSTGKVTVLTTQVDGVPFLFTDDVEVAADGKIYFSDASSERGWGTSTVEGFIHGTNGRLLEYDPATKKTKMLMDELAFGNGVAVSHDGSYVLVNETFKYKINRHWLTGPKAGTNDVFKENLPGFLDGISQGEDGIFWLAVIGQRDAALDGIVSGTLARKILLRLPFLMPQDAGHHNMILGLDGNGSVVHNFQDNTGKFHELTSIHQEGKTLYLGTLKDTYIGKYMLN